MVSSWRLNEVHAPETPLNGPPPSSADKLAFLSQASAYASAPGDMVTRETHMSWVFLAGDRVYKLKKPVRFPFLDFSTLERREAACRAELVLNRRLAPDVYLDVVPLTAGPIGPFDRRKRDSRGLAGRHAASRRETHAGTGDRSPGRSARAQLDRARLRVARFYRTTDARVSFRPSIHLAAWRQKSRVQPTCLARAAAWPPGRADPIYRRRSAPVPRHPQRAASRPRASADISSTGMATCGPSISGSKIPPRIIDCLEFNANLRAVDPLDEVAFLALECERLGGLWAARLHPPRMTPRAARARRTRRCSSSIVAIAPRCERGWRSRTCSNRTRERPRNGHVWRGPICGLQ